MDILALVTSARRSVATEALYYCLRALKQARPAQRISEELLLRHRLKQPK